MSEETKETKQRSYEVEFISNVRHDKTLYRKGEKGKFSKDEVEMFREQKLIKE
jgi:hypothetical protein